MEEYTDFPDIYYENSDNNPCISSPNSPYAIFFYQNRETLFGDADLYKHFIDNAINQFRVSRFYTEYKSYLYRIGLDRCQMLGNITVEMVGPKGLEMHHNGITIFDIAIMITNHILNVKGKVCTYDIVHLLKDAHRNNMVPLVMLCKTMHQVNHNEEEFFVPASMCFGKWTDLIYKYFDGMTFSIAKKLYYWISISLEHKNDDKLNETLIKLREEIMNWSDKNGYSFGTNKYNILNRTPGVFDSAWI